MHCSFHDLHAFKDFKKRLFMLHAQRGQWRAQSSRRYALELHARRDGSRQAMLDQEIQQIDLFRKPRLRTFAVAGHRTAIQVQREPRADVGRRRAPARRAVSKAAQRHAVQADVDGGLVGAGLAQAGDLCGVGAAFLDHRHGGQLRQPGQELHGQIDAGGERIVVDNHRQGYRLAHLAVIRVDLGFRQLPVGAGQHLDGACAGALRVLRVPDGAGRGQAGHARQHGKTPIGDTHDPRARLR
ncbi:hypothetical protein G6F65_018100 [Rhizopus arrhizus]|nr:hypothetical protein G6F65_018100 [Rhizopus arrhizus]